MNKDTTKDMIKEDLEPFVLETMQKPELSGTPGKILEILKGESVQIAKIYLDIVKNSIDRLSMIN